MLVLPIILFATEIVFIAITNALTQTNGALSQSYSWLVIFVFLICTILAIAALIKNIKDIKYSTSRGKAITGTVFSGIALLMGAIFLITVLVTVVALLGQA